MSEKKIIEARPPGQEGLIMTYAHDVPVFSIDFDGTQLDNTLLSTVYSVTNEPDEHPPGSEHYNVTITYDNDTTLTKEFTTLTEYYEVLNASTFLREYTDIDHSLNNIPKSGKAMAWNGIHYDLTGLIRLGKIEKNNNNGMPIYQFIVYFNASQETVYTYESALTDVLYGGFKRVLIENAGGGRL